ncbi:pimeloyl-ACP methyl ester carboxylesterase [Litorivivens lipolytica]|uniref:Pimeloyl-ACP methyl ester carboxylesterase n=1 Tax=Litorivivens lipolytica TaxID=1524264 RepID=A0A7W4W239_9GAMM|nr:alpha/beta hydrolase [Litorivivens lipolytica]MBB3045900.1 pimeloyl-ACP methyl ester carboxylesterase [Litorivivens lipolytica]
MKALGAKLDLQLWRIPSEIPEHEQTSIISVGSASVRLRDTGGTGNSLVFLCDPPITVEAYDGLISAFSPDFRVIVAEVPGFGFSRASSGRQLSFTGAVEIVETALASLELKSVVLFGPCICGFVATEIASRGNLPVAGVVLMQAPDKEGMLAWVERMDPKGLLRVPLFGQMLLKLNAKKTVKFWLKYATAKIFDPSSIIDVTTQSLEDGGGYPLATMLQSWSAGTKDAGLEIPGLIIWGRQDRSHLETPSECTRAHLVNGEVIEFPDCGHFSELEKPAEFAATVRPFLSRCLDGSDA